MKTLIVGLGNPILGDDGIGWKVAEEVKRLLPTNSPPEAEVSTDVICLSVGGISLMEHLIGYDHAILIDAFTQDAPVGSISVLRMDQLPNYSAFHITSTHDTSLQRAMEMGRELGAHLPVDVMVVGITIEQIHEFSEELSRSVAQVLPCAVNIVLDLLKENMAKESRLDRM